MNLPTSFTTSVAVSAGCHINDVMNITGSKKPNLRVSAGCHINDVMNRLVGIDR